MIAGIKQTKKNKKKKKKKKKNERNRHGIPEAPPDIDTRIYIYKQTQSTVAKK